jgi:hypothetical protein
MRTFAKLLCAAATTVGLLSLFAGQGLADVTMWGSGDCKALAEGDSSYCTTDDCKGIVKKDSSYCKSDFCKGVARMDASYCGSDSVCKAIAKKDKSYCP